MTVWAVVETAKTSMIAVAAITSGRWKVNTAREWRPNSAVGAKSQAGNRGFQTSSKITQALKLITRSGPNVHLSAQRLRSGGIDKSP